MAEASFRSIALTPAGNDALRVEIVASDNTDIAKSQEMVSLVVTDICLRESGSI
jgi:hypothetical protein